jgi:hypothetical protein
MSQPNEPPRYVTCRCQYCDKGIEFDANQLDVSGAAGDVLIGQTITCPHCGLDTILFVPNDQRKINPQPAKSAPPPAPPPKKVVSQPPVTPQEAKAKQESKPQPVKSVPPSPEIAVTNLIKSLIRNQPLIAWVCAAFFAVTSILFACLYLSEIQSLQKTQTALVMSEAASAELRKNVQDVQNALRQNVQKAVTRESVCGIYSCNYNGNDEQVDLRSDGRAVFFIWSSSGWWPRAKTNWELDGNTVTAGDQKFTIEGVDLIDSRGNRWLHIR